MVLKMFGELQSHLKEYFSNCRQNTSDGIFYGIGHSISKPYPGMVIVADVGVNYNDSHLKAMARGIGQDRTRLIGIDPKPRHIPGVDCYRGRAQDLPLMSREVDVMIFYDALRFINVDQNTVNNAFLPSQYPELNDPTKELQKMCSEIERVKPDCAIFTDSAMYFRMQKLCGRRHDHELIRSELSSYRDTDFQKRCIEGLYNTTVPHEWMVLVRKI